jgi:hypothetical protein
MAAPRTSSFSKLPRGLTLGSGAVIHLSGGALAKNISWQVSGSVHLGTTAHLEGNVLAQTEETLGTGATINGRLLAQTTVNIDGTPSASLLRSPPGYGPPTAVVELTGIEPVTS